MDYNWSDRSIGDSLISGIELHIGKSFMPPDKIILPLNCDFPGPSDVPYMEYDFSLEEKVISCAETERKQQAQAAEKKTRCCASAAAEQAVRSDTEEDDAGMSTSGQRMPNGHPSQSNNMGNMNMNAAALNTQPRFTTITAAVQSVGVVPAAPSHHGGILTPTLVKLQAKPQDKKHEPTINLADFEREDDPFDNVELKTINDMEVLHTVLQTTLPSLTAHNDMLPKSTGNGVDKSCGGHDSGGQMAVLPDIPMTRCLVQTSQRMSALSQDIRQQMSASYPQAHGGVPAAFMPVTNQDSIQLYATGCVKYSASPDGRVSMSHMLKGSRSSPDISNNHTQGTPRMTQGPPKYTPPPCPMRVQTPPPRFSHLQDTDKTWNRYQPLPMSPEIQTKNDTLDSARCLPPLSQTAVMLVSRVTDMGFPRNRVEQAVRNLGDNDKKVIDYLCLADNLVQKGYKMDDVESSLELFENDEKKVTHYLQLLIRFREIGFPEDKIQKALVNNDLDEGKAIDTLTGV